MTKLSLISSNALFLLVIALLWQPIPVWAHTKLTASTPADGQTVAEVSQLRLAFAGPMRLLRATITDNAGNNIGLNFNRSRTAQLQFDIPVSQPLPAATYQLMWMGMGEDGHQMEGSVSFIVDPGAGH